MWRWNGLRINKENREYPLSHTPLSIHNLMFCYCFEQKKRTNFCISNSKCHAIFTHNIYWYFLWWRHSLFFSKKNSLAPKPSVRECETFGNFSSDQDKRSHWSGYSHAYCIYIWYHKLHSIKNSYSGQYPSARTIYKQIQILGLILYTEIYDKTNKVIRDLGRNLLG